MCYGNPKLTIDFIKKTAKNCMSPIQLASIQKSSAP